MRRLALLLLPYGWLLLFIALPLLLVLGIALGEPADGVPPFIGPIGPGGRWQGSLGTFATLWEDPFYRDSLGNALRLAAITGACCLAIAYPMALGIARAPERWRPLLLLLVLLPFWTGFLPRLGAWIGLLRDSGWVNGLLLRAGLIEAPLPLLYSDGAMLAGMVHAYLPFAVLPLLAALQRADPALEEAAADLGASPATVFRTVTLPLSLPGAIAGFLLVSIPAAGEFVIPALLGPAEAELLGRVLWEEFFQTRDWPLAAALALALVVVLLPPILLLQRLDGRR